MRFAALLLTLVCACGGAVPTASQTPVPSPSAHVFSARSFTAAIYYGDPADKTSALALTAELSSAWGVATGGRSTLTLVAADPEVFVFIGNEPSAQVTEGTQGAYFVVVPGLRFVYVHRDAPKSTLAVVHEIGHVLGATHWTDCAAPPVEIMCSMQGSASTFSERELRAMGL